jgi:hypothetical protein
MDVTEIRREIVWRGLIWPRTGKNSWPVFTSTVNNHLVPQNAGYFLAVEEVVYYQEELNHGAS